MFTSLLNWFFSKSLIMMLISLVSILILLLMEKTTIIHIDFNSFVEVPINMTILIDKQSLIFTSTVSTVSCTIIMYSFHYLSEESRLNMKKFLLILLVFIFSMLILSTSANLFWLMVGWDGLGISSFCLIIFYQNWKSLSSGMVTFLSNRFGDTLIIMSMTLMILSQSSDSWMISSNIFYSILVGMGAYSKSAQMPYMFWLPQAMAAPTPVSALVHSSTLVTAGIFVMCRFQPQLNYSLSILFFSISSITIMIAGTSSLMEFDLKKIIALSTLCHISLMMMFSIFGETELCMFHLMMHAFFKSTLFMVAGYLIHTNYNSQDIRFIKMPKLDLSVSFPFFMSVLSMMGCPFMSGYYSKEMLLMKSSFSLPSLLMTFIFLINSLFSCAYSTRMSMFILSNNNKITFIPSKNPFSSIFITCCFLSSFLGGMISHMIIMEEQEMIQSSLLKILLTITSLLGIIIGMTIDTTMASKFLKNMMTELWKSNFLYKIFQEHFFLLSYFIMWKMDEKGVYKFLSKTLFTKTLSLSQILQELFFKDPFSIIKIPHIVFMTTLMWLM